jgi:hypothetical protein
MRPTLPILAVAAACAAPAASASQLLDRGAASPQLAVNAKGEALVTYLVGGNVKRVLAWGAVNAIAPTRTRRQVSFRLDYAGGWGRYHRQYWRSFDDACRPYDGPQLPWQEAVCKAPDGSYWALQAWQRALPNLGVRAESRQAAPELRLSHWTGELPRLEVHVNWAYRRYDHLFGTYTYAGKPVYGYRSTGAGAPLDTFGRNVYLDTFDSAYGNGWKRENSFLTHTGTGAFCYGVYPHQNGSNRPAGKGRRYRATVEGPGVAPDVTWEGAAPGPYDADLDRAANALIAGMNDRTCRPN